MKNKIKFIHGRITQRKKLSFKNKNKAIHLQINKRVFHNKTALKTHGRKFLRQGSHSDSGK